MSLEEGTGFTCGKGVNLDNSASLTARLYGEQSPRKDVQPFDTGLAFRLRTLK